jgi:cell division protease FtsH
MSVRMEVDLEEEIELDEEAAEAEETATPSGRTLSPTPPRAHSLDALAGLSEIKSELRAQIRLWSDAEPIRALGGTPRLGFIFAGPTGTGKTTAAHALAAETGRELYTFAGPDFQGAAGRDLLTTVLATMARQRAVVFVDEADDLLHARNFRRERSDSLVKHLLVELDRTTREIRSFFVFATNLDIERIDVALCRPGRLGRPLVFRGLTTSERIDLLANLSGAYRLAPGIALEPIAAQLGGLPTSSLVHVLDEAAFVAARDGHDQIQPVDLQEATSRLRVGLARSRSWGAEELRRSAIHEAGHAIVRLVLGGSWESVAWVEVDARADGSFGAMFSGEEDLALLTEADMRDQLTVSMAGRTAERLVTGVADAAAASDLRAATSLAGRAVAEWGFSERGPVTVAADYAEAILEADIDRAMRQLVVEAERRAADILAAHRGALDALTERLVLQRAGTGRDLAEWLAGFDLFPTMETAR